MAHRVCLIGLLAGGYSGVPRYAHVLSQALDRVAPEFDELELSLATTHEGAERVGATNLEVRRVPLRGRHANAGPGRIALEQIVARAVPSDLLHFFDVNGPVLPPVRPFVATVHDVSVLRGLRPRKHAYKRRLWPWVARRARRLVAISEYARAEAIELLAVPPERIQALPSGPGFMPPMEGGKAADGDRPYLLYVGALAASKNLPFLVEAYDRTTAEVALVLAGKPGDGYAELQAAMDGMRRRGDVTILGEVSDERLDSLYRGAVALVHPSLYEGFGFTPLEAMSRGCPVVASDIPALREIAGEGAALVPIERAEDWAAAIERIASDESWRNELRERGRVRVSGYSWDETARGLCRLFLDVLGAGR